MPTLYLLTTEYIDPLVDAMIVDASDMETAQRLAKKEISEDIISDARRGTNDWGNEELDRVDPDKLLWTEDSIQGWELKDPDRILESLNWRIHLREAKILRAT